MTISQITLPTPFLVGPVHCWLLQDEKTILVDCGPKTNEARNALVAALGTHQCTFADIDEIWLTHAHPDHFGLAAEIQRIRNIPVFLHPWEKDNLDNTSHKDSYLTLFLEGAVPQEFIKLMSAQRVWYTPFFDVPEEIEWLTQDTILTTGKTSFQVVPTPGHSPGHVSFLNSDRRVIFSGDVLIEHVSSNALLSFDEFGQRRDSLAHLRESLALFQEFEGIAYPGHGSVIHAPALIAKKHLSAQNERYLWILEHITQPLSWFEITQKVFPPSAKRDYSFLTLSEVLGYLDRGITEELLHREMINGIWYYSRI